MEDELSHKTITHDALRLFGIKIKVINDDDDDDDNDDDRLLHHDVDDDDDDA